MAEHEEDDFDLDTMHVAADVTVDRRPGPKATFAIRLESGVVDELRALAEQRHMGPTQLVRQWVVERLEAERAGPHADTEFEDKVLAIMEKHGVVPKSASRRTTTAKQTAARSR